MNTLKTPYAKTSERTEYEFKDLVHARDAVKDLDYFCPKCNGVVRLKKGEVRRPYFSHQKDTSCDSASETLIHLLAKEVISNLEFIWLPHSTATLEFTTARFGTEFYFETCEGSQLSLYSQKNIPEKFPKYRFIHEEELKEVLYENSYRGTEIREGILEEMACLHKIRATKSYGWIKVDSVRVEVYVNDIKPDLIISSGGQDFIIEVANTHKVDAAKRKKLKKMNIPTLEIELSEVFQVDGYIDVRLMEEVFTTANTGIKWIIHEAGESLKKEVLEQVPKYLEDFNKDASKKGINGVPFTFNTCNYEIVRRTREKKRSFYEVLYRRKDNGAGE